MIWNQEQALFLPNHPFYRPEGPYIGGKTAVKTAGWCGRSGSSEPPAASSSELSKRLYPDKPHSLAAWF